MSYIGYIYNAPCTRTDCCPCFFSFLILIIDTARAIRVQIDLLRNLEVRDQVKARPESGLQRTFTGKHREKAMSASAGLNKLYA